jgi:hypothetical protein
MQRIGSIVIAFALVGCSQGSEFSESPDAVASEIEQQSADNSLTEEKPGSDSDWHVHLPTEVSGINLVDCVALVLHKQDDWWVCNTKAPNWREWKFEIAAKGGRVAAEPLDCIPGVCDFRVQMPIGTNGRNAGLVTTPPSELPSVASVKQPSKDAQSLTVQRSTNGLVFPNGGAEKTSAIQTTGPSSFYFGRAGGIAVECQQSAPSQPIVVNSNLADSPSELFTAHFTEQNEVATLLQWRTSEPRWWEVRCNGTLKISFL